MAETDLVPGSPGASDAPDLRIPFAEAVTERSLLGDHWETLSLAQQTALRALYGLEIPDSPVDRLGFSGRDYWHLLQDRGDFDDLGYPIRRSLVVPRYQPQEFREGWFIIGRRGGKTDRLASTIVAYEATMGGHEAFLRRGQRGVVFQIAQDMRMARYALHFIKATLESSPLLKKEISQITADRIDLKNGLTIACVPPTLKSVRGYASPVAVLDEVGVWYQESDSANPDYEIYRAVKPTQLQFPNPKIVGISSPWNKAGLLFRVLRSRDGGRETARRAEEGRIQRGAGRARPDGGAREPACDPRLPRAGAHV